MKYTTTLLTRVPLKLSLIAMAIFATPFATAQESGWYGGATMGASRANIDDAQIITNLVGAGMASGTVDERNADHGYKFFSGYQFGKNFAIEGSYFDLGTFGFTATTVPPGTLNGEIKLRGIGMDAVLTLPITEKFSVFGRLGANYAEARDTFSGTGAVGVSNPNPSKMEINPKIGLGIQYAITESLSLRAEVERYRINDAVGTRGDVDMATIGLVYYFGLPKPKPVARTIEPEPMPIALAPEPVVAVAPPPPPPAPAPILRPLPVPVKMTFSADSFFGFDKSDINPDGRQDLDKLAQDLQGLDYAVVRVTGHTDRLGSHAYNMKLSTRRAQAVQRYLTESAGVPADKIEAIGVDGANPVTNTSDCIGNTATKALIACLQPDRRVDIEVSGTR